MLLWIALFLQFGYFILGQQCYFPAKYRAKWVMMPQNLSDVDSGFYIIVRRNYIEIILNGSQIFFNCHEASENSSNLLLEALGDRKEYLCLRFDKAENSSADYQLRRSNYAMDNLYFHGTIEKNPTIATTCNLTTENDPINLRRSSPGCEFPEMLRKSWKYDGHGEFDRISFTVNKSIVQVTATKNSLTFNCERIDEPYLDIYLIAMRAPNVTQENGRNKDGVLCLFYQNSTLKDLNSGTMYNNSVKIIDPADPVYIHQTCDKIDQQFPEFQSELSVVA